ncbi:MAG: hypothetical protein H6742_13870 [Alphaproteobacteria bacterium]|nr:hypothetical protein [Alphaproteobacteria bacterium]
MRGGSRKTLFVCTGSDCRNQQKDIDKLVADSSGVARVREVRCQKICEGPVCGLVIDDELAWFEQVSGKKLRRAVVALLEGGEADRALDKRRVDKRAGKLRK